MMSIMNYFPQTDKIQQPRQQQIDALLEYERLRLSGARKFIFCAPTGSGKSGIAKTIANFEASGTLSLRTVITSPLNSLVDQYEAEFRNDRNRPAGSTFVTLKGRAHYPCVASNGEYTCDDGYCQVDQCSIPTVTIVNKKHIEMHDRRECEECAQMRIDNYNKCKCGKCAYKKVMNDFKREPIVNTNFTMLQIGLATEKNVVIVDECDNMETFIRMFRNVTIKDERWRFPHRDDYIMCIESKISDMKFILDHDDWESKGIKKKKHLMREISKYARLLEDMTSVENHKYVVNEKSEKDTPFVPVDINRFIDDALGVNTVEYVPNKTNECVPVERVVILMSATPLKLAGWEYIEVDSPFDKNLRPFRYVPIGSMSLANRRQTIPKLAKMLINRDHLLPGKTIVHVASYEIAAELGRQILSIHPIIQTRADNTCNEEGMVIRNEVVERFKRSHNPNQVFIAVNMGRGIDLPELDIINNIITYVKRNNPDDSLVRARYKYEGKEWEYQEAANEAMQQYGRANRNDKKVTNTIITEPEWVAFYKKNKKYFKKWFVEAIV